MSKKRGMAKGSKTEKKGGRFCHLRGQGDGWGFENKGNRVEEVGISWGRGKNREEREPCV